VIPDLSIDIAVIDLSALHWCGYTRGVRASRSDRQPAAAALRALVRGAAKETFHFQDGVPVREQTRTIYRQDFDARTAGGPTSGIALMRIVYKRAASNA